MSRIVAGAPPMGVRCSFPAVARDGGAVDHGVPIGSSSPLLTENALCFRRFIIMRRTEVEMSRNVEESQPLLWF